MRLSKAELGGRVNRGEAELRFSSKRLTSHGGLELLRRHWRALGLEERLRRQLGGRWPATDYGAVRLMLLLLTLVVVGGRRLRHLLFLEGDPLVSRATGLKRLPTPRTLARWLGRLNRHRLTELQAVNEELVAETLQGLQLRRLTVDVDGSIVSTGQQVQWAQRGFNPHHRKVPSYYPITAYEAQSGLLLRVRNRPGNVHDGKASLGFLGDLNRQIQNSLSGPRIVEYRMDGAFFRADVLDLLQRQGAEYAIKVPFHPWLHLKPLVASRRRWKRVDRCVSCFESMVRVDAWNRTLRIVIYRKKVQHQTRKNFQLDLFDPDDGHYEYSAITTNKTLKGPALWFFLCGRGSHEKAYGELRSGFAFDAVPSSRYAANGAWQILSVFAFNLIRRFQIDTGLPRRRPTRTRTCLFPYETIQTLRYTFFNRAALLVTPNGRLTLDLGHNTAVKKRFLNLEHALAG